MTGAEIVGVGVAAAKGAKKVADALGGDAKEQEQLSRLAEDTKALEVAANARADRVAIRQLVLTKLYAPLAKWVGYKSDYFENQFADDMAEKLADVPEEHITSPSPVVAAQSMEGLSYSLDEPDLKEMYLNLLATASDSRRSEEAHPSFAQIIKQLSPGEASLLLGVLHNKRMGTPLVEIRSEKDGAWQTLQRHVFNTIDPNTGVALVEPRLPLYVDNWVRLGLVEASNQIMLKRDGAYEWIESRPEMMQAREIHKSLPDRSVGVQKGVLMPTALGLQFAEAVTPPVAPGENS